MEKQDITPKEVKAPQEEVAKVAEKPKSKEKTLNIILLVILLLLLIPALYLLIMGNVLKFNPDSAKEKSSINSEQITTEEECKCEKCTEKECPVLEDGECKCPSVLTADPGFAIFSVPELKVTIEVPDHTMAQDIEGQEILSTWDTRLWQVDYKQHLYFNNYEKTISSYFFPTYIPEGAGFGRGGVKESSIDIHVFGNKSNLTLEQARDRYLEKFQEETQGDGTVTGEIKTKWNERTYEFKMTSSGGSLDGNLLVKNGKIYQITYFVAGTGDANRYSQRVINSIKFN